MRIYYIVPPNGVNQYKSMAAAQAAFESGEVWECTGTAVVDEDTGRVTQVQRFGQRQPARYSECRQILTEEGDVVTAIPLTWAMQWQPGRVAFLRFKVYPGERKVSYQYGKGKGVDLIDKRKTKTEKYQERRIVRKQMEAREHELREQGGWMTSGGLRFRPFYYDEDLGRNNFPMIVWHPSGMTGPVSLDANPACRTLGDRELEKWFVSAKYRAHNAYASPRLTASAQGGLVANGGYRTKPAPDSDTITDSEVQRGQRIGADFKW